VFSVLRESAVQRLRRKLPSGVQRLPTPWRGAFGSSFAFGSKRKFIGFAVSGSLSALFIPSIGNLSRKAERAERSYDEIGINPSTHQHISTSAHQPISTSAHQHISTSAHQHIEKNTFPAVLLYAPVSFLRGRHTYYIFLACFLLKLGR